MYVCMYSLEGIIIQKPQHLYKKQKYFWVKNGIYMIGTIGNGIPAFPVHFNSAQIISRWNTAQQCDTKVRVQ